MPRKVKKKVNEAAQKAAAFWASSGKRSALPIVCVEGEYC